MCACGLKPHPTYRCAGRLAVSPSSPWILRRGMYYEMRRAHFEQFCFFHGAESMPEQYAAQLSEVDPQKLASWHAMAAIFARGVSVTARIFFQGNHAAAQAL